MTPAERVATDTWRRLGQASALGARLGEETLTDLLVMDMLPHERTNGFRIGHPTKAQEYLCGADLLLFIRYPDGSGRRIALQAKKRYPDGRYATLASKDATGMPQIDKLEGFARLWGAVPVYMLYNHVDGLPANGDHWHCCQSDDAGQLGCTLVPTWLVRKAIGRRGHRTFEAIHEDEATRPWRCVFDCEKAVQRVDELSGSRPELQSARDKAVFLREGPDWLRKDSVGMDLLFEMEGTLSPARFDSEVRPDLQAGDGETADVVATYPRRVLIVDVGDVGVDPERE